jgi:hypothetical protein
MLHPYCTLYYFAGKKQYKAKAAARIIANLIAVQNIEKF